MSRFSSRCALVVTIIFAGVLVTGLARSPAVTAAEPTSSPAGSASAGGDEVVLRIGTTQDADNLNPFIGYSTTAYEAFHLNYDLLVGYAANGDPRPELATSWSRTPDGLVWTFKTREGVTWQDGVPFTARDVAFTYNYIIENDLSAFSSYTRNMTKAVAVDDTTVKFVLKKPKPSMLRTWIPIVPEHIWSRISGDKAANSFQNDPPIIGTGPFQVVEVKKGGFIRLKANRGYWGGAPTVDEVILEVYQNQDTMTMDLKSGSIDAAVGLPVAQFDSLKSEPGITATAAEGKSLVELCMNCYDSPDSLGNPVLKDMRFRQAISWAVDKQKIVATCLGGYAEVGESILVPSTDDAWTPTAAETFGYDPEKAKQLLDAAGYKDTNGDGVREDKQGKPIKLRLWTREESPEQQRAGKLIAGAFETIGIPIELTVMNEGSISDALYSYKGDTYAPDYDLYIWGWSGGADPDYMLPEFTTAQIEMWNDCCWSSAEYDRLLGLESTQIDAAKRKTQVTRMQQIFYEQAPYAVLYYPKELIAYNTSRWKSWVPYPNSNGLVVMSGDNVDSYVRLKPDSVSTGSSTSSGVVWMVLGGAIVAVSAVAITVRRRHRRGRSEEE
jgi:peptide/nickel transport system substrate-binding protein